jgi:hypothetical protein
VQLGTYFLNLFGGGPTFHNHASLGFPIAETMHILEKIVGMEPLVYLVMWHDLGSFQHKRTKAALEHQQKNLLKDPEPFLGCSPPFLNGLDTAPAWPSRTMIIFDIKDPVPVEMWDWKVDITTENIRKGLHRLFHSTIKAHFFTATRAEPNHRILPHLFRIAMARCLRLPVHAYCRKCKCKK